MIKPNYIYMNRALQRLFSNRPDSERVSQIKDLGEFINEYPGEELLPSLFLLHQKYKYYRPVCGDGNCFYRCCMYLYFCLFDLSSFKQLFPYAPIQDCFNVPFAFEDIDPQQLLKYIWETYLRPLQKLDFYSRQKELVEILNSSVLLDAFLIAYFRSLNFNYLIRQSESYKDFIEGNVHQYFNPVLKYGRQSEGLQLFGMAEVLSARIKIVMVHQENYQQIICKENQRREFLLFFRPGHYQILCTEEEYRRQGSQSRLNSALKRQLSRHQKRRTVEEVRINSFNDMKKLQKNRSLSSKIQSVSKPFTYSQFINQASENKSPIKKPEDTTFDKRSSNSNSFQIPDRTSTQGSRSSEPAKKEQFRASKIKVDKPSDSTPNPVKKSRMISEGAIILSFVALIYWASSLI